jgi:Flp pilus assembly pilin Flp
MWKRIQVRLISALSSESGEAYVEYVTLAGLAILVILGAVQYFFGGIADLFQRLGDVLRGIG